MSTDLKVNPYGQFFTDGEQQLSIEVAWLDEKNEDNLNNALIKITGRAAHSEGIDGKTFLYTAIPAGTGFNFTYLQDGQEFTRMMSRSTWGSWKFFEVYVNNQTFKVYPDEVKSKDVRPLHLVTDYKKTAKVA